MHTTTFPAVAGAHAACAASIVDTRTLGPSDVMLRMPLEPCDALEQIALAERADWVLLRLVLCVAAATLLLAVASNLSL